MEPPAALGGLVTPVRGSLVLPSHGLRAGSAAVTLTAVTASAHHDLTVASIAGEQPLALHLPPSSS
jgi:hypothetical protein